MDVNWGILSGVVQAITLFYLYYQFHYLPKKARKEALSHIRTLFLLSRNKIESLLNSLTDYYVKNDCANEEFTQGTTFISQALQLRHLILADLNDDVLEGALSVATTDPIIATVVDSINKQIFETTKLEAYFNTAYKFKAN